MTHPPIPKPPRASWPTPSNWSSWPGPSADSRSGWQPIPPGILVRPTCPPTGTYLAEKLRLADFAVTQFFFRAEEYLGLVDDLAERGISTPVVPGIMPVTALSSIGRMAEMGAAVPGDMAARLERAGDAESVRRMGTEMATAPLPAAARCRGAGAALLHAQSLAGDAGDLRQPGPGCGRVLIVGRMRSAVCDLLGIDFPLLAFSHCRDVVAAVTNAGGFGVLGASSHSPDDLDVELHWIDEHTGGRPYGADILVPARVVGRGEDLSGPSWPPWCPMGTATSWPPCSSRMVVACRPRGRWWPPAPAGWVGATRPRN